MFLIFFLGWDGDGKAKIRVRLNKMIPSLFSLIVKVVRLLKVGFIIIAVIWC